MPTDTPEGRKLFLKNLLLFVLGLGLQVVAMVFPVVQMALVGPASLLLSLADLRVVTDGSFWKHLGLFLAGILCQLLSGLIPDARAELMGAGAVLMSNSNIRRIFRGPESPPAEIVAAGAPGKPPAG